ncbi:MAG: hypothetical protein ACRBK7_00605 [Acidimicrobiales bacterium]
MQNSRQTIWRCLAALSISVAFISLAWLPAMAGAQPVVGVSDAPFAAVADTPPDSAVPDIAGPDIAVPDIALIVSDLDDRGTPILLDRLGSIDGVMRVTSDVVSAEEVVFYLVRSNVGGARSVDAIVAQADRIVMVVAPDASILAGGSAVVDQVLLGRFRATARALVFFGALVGLAMALAFGWRRGLLSAGALAITVACGASIGSQVGGDFDGTITTTAVPGALAALVVGIVMSLRLSLWFRRPVGDDGAEMIRNAAGDLLVEFALVFSGLVFSAVLVELLSPGRSPLTVVAISAIVAAVVVTAIMAPGLAILSGHRSAARFDVPVSIPDGRDLPLLILGAVAVGLAIVSVFAFRQPGVALLDVDRLDAESAPALVAAKLAVAGGDATTALIATKPVDVSQADFEAWALGVVERPEVERVDLASGRLLSTGPVEVPDSTLLVPPAAQSGSQDTTSADAAISSAVVVLNVSPRSEAGQQAVDLLASPSLTGGVQRLEGYGVQASALTGSTAVVVIAVIALAAAAALAMQVLTQSRSRSAVVFVLRVIGGGASVGIYRLMAPGATMAESLTVLAGLALAVGLLQLEFVGQRIAGPQSGLPADPVSPANPGQFAGFAIAALGLAGIVVALTTWFGGGPDIGRFGLGLFAAVLIELLAGALLLTPALLGQRAAFHTAVRPVRIALHATADRADDEQAGPEDPAWRRVVGDLLQAEFRLQAHPAEADLDMVFVPDTPLFRQAATHHASLGQADLRIVGRSPRLRSLKTISGRSSVSLAITVDHPERHLVDRSGSVVGVRKPERRSGVLWLSEMADGSFRIAESVELGSVPLPEAENNGHGDDDVESPGSGTETHREIRLDDEPEVTGELRLPQEPLAP